MKYIYIYLSAVLLFSACSEDEKQKVVKIIQDINIKNDEKVATVTELTNSINESSGLVYIDDVLWTHNDSQGEAILYAIDKKSSDIVKKLIFPMQAILIGKI